MLLPETTLDVQVWALTYGQEDVQWSCLCQDHTDGSGLHSHLESWYFRARAAAEGHVWLHGPMIHRVWVDIHDTTKSCENDQDLFSHLRISQCLRTMPLLTHIDLCSLRCHCGHGDIWAWSTVYGHVWVLSPAVAVVRMSMASVNTGVHRNHTSRNQEVVLNQSCPSVILG